MISDSKGARTPETEVGGQGLCHCASVSPVLLFSAKDIVKVNAILAEKGSLEGRNMDKNNTKKKKKSRNSIITSKAKQAMLFWAVHANVLHCQAGHRVSVFGAQHQGWEQQHPSPARTEVLQVKSQGYGSKGQGKQPGAAVATRMEVWDLYSSSALQRDFRIVVLITSSGRNAKPGKKKAQFGEMHDVSPVLRIWQ